MKLSGFRTYYLVAVGLLYLLGSFAGWYDLDERVIAGLGLSSIAFLRAGVNKMAPPAMCFLVIALASTGCKSPEVGAYRVLGTITATVDAWMQTWGNAIKRGLPNDEQVAQSRIFYARYQGAIRVARDMTLSYKNAEVDHATWEKAVDAAAAAADDLIAFIYSILPDEKPVGLKPLSD